MLEVGAEQGSGNNKWKKIGRAASANKTGFGLRMMNINMRPFKKIERETTKKFFSVIQRDYLNRKWKYSYVDTVSEP